MTTGYNQPTFREGLCGDSCTFRQLQVNHMWGSPKKKKIMDKGKLESWCWKRPLISSQDDDTSWANFPWECNQMHFRVLDLTPLGDVIDKFFFFQMPKKVMKWGNFQSSPSNPTPVLLRLTNHAILILDICISLPGDLKKTNNKRLQR